MQRELEERLQDFAQQARALADQIQQEGGRPSAIGPRGDTQSRVNVMLPWAPSQLVRELRAVADAVDHYRNFSS
ncbi:MAG: hypothetical protein ACYCT1_05030 [Steroidobacteraceae bacterium]